jgi:hypothetical protein
VLVTLLEKMNGDEVLIRRIARNKVRTCLKSQ